MQETSSSSGPASPSPGPLPETLPPPDVSVADVLACDYVCWYPAFEKVALPSLILPLPAPVLAYLRDSASLVVPQECQAEMNHSHHDRLSEDEEEGHESLGAGDAPGSPWSSSEDVSATCPTFPDFTRQIRTSLTRLGGNAFCKLNWSAPRDATWLALGHSLRCHQASQIYLLLKGSDLVGHDLHRPFEQCSEPPEPHIRVPYSLILKPWLDINPGHEFRAFVRHGRLVGVSQRDVSTFFDHLLADRVNILGDIRSFFGEYIQSRFHLAHYTFDVVRSTKDRVQLVDFAPWGGVTDPLLFDWHELANLSPDSETLCRFIPTAAGIQPNGLRQYSLPRDMVDLATGQDPLKLMDFLQLQTRTDRPGTPDDEQG
ncbi:hypothetical protein TCAL_03615 [Tigriopus californicus]|uniref:Uncharacterized protein n=1 Tax=Tigriopus californicus TaxID=6832 RepID=A0A553NE33_TIGCA|nr:cell division cycle protein 123 homolog [Tigriopus californicus]TRY63706.1 hypothetical protein TCAL_03615 [Tigriopus californicus]|eukprot:TCALIF_03615-PA protein Name:"Similar to cdc123 Cell division cycle protein 123 homolog (Xenopus tropicalis)" AED:0.00 eAED:0.00 QI:0/-1/0/1/-1/1/1/0/371